MWNILWSATLLGYTDVKPCNEDGSAGKFKCSFCEFIIIIGLTSEIIDLGSMVRGIRAFHPIPPKNHT